jgi:hypothetical protein
MPGIGVATVPGAGSPRVRSTLRCRLILRRENHAPPPPPSVNPTHARTACSFHVRGRCVPAHPALFTDPAGMSRPPLPPAPRPLNPHHSSPASQAPLDHPMPQLLTEHQHHLVPLDQVPLVPSWSLWLLVPGLVVPGMVQAGEPPGQ